MATREEMTIVMTARDMTAGAFNSLRRNVSLVQSALVGIGGSAVYSAIRRSVSSLDDMGDAAERLGTTTDVFQALRYQIGQSGGSAEMAERAFDRFSDAIVEASQGSNALTRFFEANNVSMRTATGGMRSFDDALEITARLVAGLNSEQERLKVATDLFGRQSGPRMVGTLQEIAQRGLNGVTAAAREAGQVLDGSVINRAGELDNRFQAVERQLSNTFKEFMVNIAPALIVVIGALGTALRAVTDAARFLGSHLLVEIDYFNLYHRGIDASTLSAERLANAIDMVRARGGAVRPEWTAALEELQRASADTARTQVTVGSTNMALHDSFQQAIKAAEQRTRAAQIDAAVLGLEADAAARLRTQMELNNVMTDNNIARTAQYTQAIERVTATVGSATAALDRKKQAWEGLNDASRFAGNQLVTVVEDLMSRTKSGADIARAALRALINQLLQAVLVGEGALAKILGTTGPGGGTGGVVGSLGRAITDALGSAMGGGAVGNAGTAHTGGIVGALAMSRRVPALAFAGAPRFHAGGIIGDEVPVIARRGEEIGWPGQLARKYGGDVQVNINNYSGAPIERTESRDGDGRRVIDIVVGQVMDKFARGDADPMMRGRYGLSPTTGRR